MEISDDEMEHLTSYELAESDLELATDIINTYFKDMHPVRATTLATMMTALIFRMFVKPEAFDRVVEAHAYMLREAPIEVPKHVAKKSRN